MSGGPNSSADQTQVAKSEPGASVPSYRWFQRRPIPVWIVFVLTSLNMLGVVVAISNSGILGAIAAGDVSLSHAFLGFLFPLLLFLGGLSLFLMRKVTIL